VTTLAFEAHETIKRAAVESAVDRALNESVSDASQEASRLRAALVELRKEHADQDRDHTREREHAASEQAKAFAAMHARSEELQRGLFEAERQIHHADAVGLYRFNPVCP
jgi:hypothetical protein